MSEELRPCPFCGGEAFYIKIMGNYEKPHEIYCSKCDGAITEGRSEKQVVTNWNTRPIEDELQARIAELEAERRWIPVSERLPDTKIVYDEFDVIVELGDIESGEMIRRVDLLSYDYRNKSWNDDCGEFGFYPVTGVTHWRERPTPPEAQE